MVKSSPVLDFSVSVQLSKDPPNFLPTQMENSIIAKACLVRIVRIV